MLRHWAALGFFCGLLGLAAGTAPGSPVPDPSAPNLVVPDRVRVGLATDLESVTMPCCGSDLRAQAGRTQVALVEPFEVAPAASGGRGVYRLQVAALKDEAQAGELAAELGRGARRRPWTWCSTPRSTSIGCASAAIRCVPMPRRPAAAWHRPA